MSRYKYTATIVGTWERHSTTGADVQVLRDNLKYIPEVEHTVKYITFVTRRDVRHNDRGWPVRHGTFEARIEVRARTRVVAKSRAFQELDNIVKDYACRAPKLKLDRQASVVTYRWQA